MFSENRVIVVLGDPGSGKTTLLGWLAAMAGGLLPVPVSVSRLAEVRVALGETASVPDALARYFHERGLGSEQQVRNFLIKQLEARSCLVLLDGLDEVDAQERPALNGWLESFANSQAGNRFVATSRIAGFSGFAPSGSAVVSTRKFDEAQPPGPDAIRSGAVGATALLVRTQGLSCAARRRLEGRCKK